MRRPCPALSQSAIGGKKMPWSHVEGAEFYLHLLLSSTPEGDECSTLCPFYFTIVRARKSVK